MLNKFGSLLKRVSREGKQEIYDKDFIMPAYYQSKVIEAPIQEVWKRISDLKDLSLMSNIVSSFIKDGNLHETEVGVKRISNRICEEIFLRFNMENHTLNYSISERLSTSVSMNSYAGKVKLFSITRTNQTYIEWQSSWEINNPKAEYFFQSIHVVMMNELNNTMQRDNNKWQLK